VKADERPWIGRVALKDDKATITNPIIKGTPLYEAGLDMDDEIVSLNHEPIKNMEDIKRIVMAHKAGDVMEITYRHRNVQQSASLTVASSPLFTISSISEGSNKRDVWLGSKLN
jgi:S1-C subfamily serine protease